jgi:integrase
MQILLSELIQINTEAHLEEVQVSHQSKYGDSVWDFFHDESLKNPSSMAIRWLEFKDLPPTITDEIKLISLLLLVEKSLKPATVVGLIKAFRKFISLICKETAIEVSGTFVNTVEYLCDVDFDLLVFGISKYYGRDIKYVFRVLRFIPGCNLPKFLGGERTVSWNRNQIDTLPHRIIPTAKRKHIFQLEDSLVHFLIRNATYLANLFMYKLTGADNYKIQFESNRDVYKSIFEDVEEFPLIFDYIKQLLTESVTLSGHTLRKRVRTMTGNNMRRVYAEIYLIQSACQYLVLQFSGMRYSEAINVKYNNLVEGPFGVLLIKGHVVKNRKSRHITNTESWATVPLVKTAFDVCRRINEITGQERIFSSFQLIGKNVRSIRINSSNVINRRLNSFLVGVDVERKYSHAPATNKPQEMASRVKLVLPEFHITSHRIRHTVANQLIKGGLNVVFLSAHFKHMSMSLYALLSVPDVTLGYGNISFEILRNRQLTDRAVSEIEDIMKKRKNIQGPGANSFIQLRDSLEENDSLSHVVDVNLAYCLGRNKIISENGSVEDPPCSKVGECQAWRCRNAFVTVDKLDQWIRFLSTIDHMIAQEEYAYLIPVLNPAKLVAQKIINNLSNDPA